MRLSIKNMKCGLLCFEVVLPPGAFLFTVPQFSEPRMAQKWLASFCSQRYNADSQRYEKRSPSLSAKDTGKGWGAFLTTDPTTHRPGPHGNSMVKEAQRWSGAEPKQLKMAGNARKKFQGLVRIREVVGSNPIRSTKDRLVYTGLSFLCCDISWSWHSVAIAQSFSSVSVFQTSLRLRSRHGSDGYVFQ